MANAYKTKYTLAKIQAVNDKRLKKGMWEGRPTAAQISYLLKEVGSLKLELAKTKKDLERWKTFKRGHLE